MQPDPHTQDIEDRPTPPFSGTLPEEPEAGTPLPSDKWPPTEAARAAEIAREQGQLDLELARISVAGEKAKLRIEKAAARKAEHEADQEKAKTRLLNAQAAGTEQQADQEKAKAKKFDAEATAAQHVADSIPREKRRAGAYEWLRISCIAIAFALTVGFLILALIWSPLTLIVAAFSGGSLKPVLSVLNHLEQKHEKTNENETTEDETN